MSWRAQISRSIQELRFVACDTSQSSKGLRCVPASGSVGLYRQCALADPATRSRLRSMAFVLIFVN